MQFFTKLGKIICWRPRRVGAPSYGESWIRHCSYLLIICAQLNFRIEGGVRDAFLLVQFLSFSCTFQRKNLTSNRFAPHSWGWRPYIWEILYPSLSLQWRIQGGRPFSISCSFWENLTKSYVGAPPRRVGAPSYRESWIRPWPVRLHIFQSIFVHWT